MSTSAIRLSARAAARVLAPLLIGVVLSVLATAPSLAAVDRREMQAREAFAAGRYQEALDIYVKLYAEKLHPNYLRNIGRCYQDLGQPDRAISSFREYLRKAKAVSSDERKEIEGFISEMEELKTKQERDKQAATPAPARPGGAGTDMPPAAQPAAPPPAAPAPPPAAAPAVLVLSAPTPGTEAPAKDEAPPLYKRWWFWALVGGVVAAGLGGAAAAGVFTKKNDAVCSTGRICQ